MHRLWEGGCQVEHQKRDKTAGTKNTVRKNPMIMDRQVENYGE